MPLTPEQRRELLRGGWTKEEVEDPLCEYRDHWLFCTHCRKWASGNHITCDRHLEGLRAYWAAEEDAAAKGKGKKGKGGIYPGPEGGAPLMIKGGAGDKGAEKGGAGAKGAEKGAFEKGFAKGFQKGLAIGMNILGFETYLDSWIEEPGSGIAGSGNASSDSGIGDNGSGSGIAGSGNAAGGIAGNGHAADGPGDGNNSLSAVNPVAEPRRPWQ